MYRLVPVVLLFVFPSQCEVSKPLMLTPLLQSGRYLEAQQRSLVPSLLPGLLSSGYSGFITVDEDAQSHLHFWFQPRDDTPNWHDYPIVLWIQGGVALTILRATFQENVGAFNFTPDGEILKCQYGLTHYVNVLFIDPTNVGFSHTSDPNYILDDSETIAEEYYSVLSQFFLLFPDLPRSLYIGGLSNAVKKVATLGNKILKRDRRHIDVLGVIVGDGSIDMETDFDPSDYYYNFGLIDKKMARKISDLHDTMHAYSNTGEKDPKDIFWNIVDGLNKVLGQKDTDLVDIMRGYTCHDYWLDYINRDDIRSKLHVGPLKFTLETENPKIRKREESNKPLFEFILNTRTPVFRFTGQYDGIVPYERTVHTLRDLDWFGMPCLGTRQFERKQVWQGGKLVGYYRKCGILWEMLFLRVSHVVYYFIPRNLWTFVNKFIEETNTRPGV